MNEPRDDDSKHTLQRQTAVWRTSGTVVIVALMLYLLVAYLIVPALWIRYARRHPALDETPGVTLTGDDHPGDPINVALIGAEDDLKKIMLAAGWFPADPITLKSCLKIAAGTVL